MEHHNYASVFGGQINFGPAESCPNNMDLIIDTRDIRDGIYTSMPTEKTRCYPIWPYFEPELREVFEQFMCQIIELVKETKTVYIVDPDGTERSAMVAWYLLFNVSRISINDALSLVNMAYQKRSNKPIKWSNSVVPRFERQKVFCRYYLRDVDWRAFERSLKLTAYNATRQNSKRICKGDLRSGQIIADDISKEYCDPMIDKYEMVRLIGDENWSVLSFDNKVLIRFPELKYEGDRTNEFAYCFTNLFHGISVYREQLDDDGNVTEDFYSMRTAIFHLPNPLTRHPMSIKNLQTGEWEPPLFCLWMGQRMAWREAKVNVISSLYENVVRPTFTFKKLTKKLDTGVNVLIGDHDGFDFKEHDLQYREYAKQDVGPWGASHILYGMLTNQLVWAQEKSSTDSSIVATCASEVGQNQRTPKTRTKSRHVK